ncbi:MAG: DUF4864 domain-containing protein [Pseudomonadota bacterium]|nr:DUF4864 domain-containing protein [Pseudomonadota bacterium]
MRDLFIATILSLGLAGPVSAQGDAPGGAIQSVIDSQFQAFRADDFDRAFTFASPTIRSIFGTSDTFGAMVRNGYPMVHRPEGVQFLDLREVDGALWQRVQIRDAQGAFHLLDYQMIETENGWKINAVNYVPNAGAAV